MYGARITDAIGYYRQKGELKGAVRVVREREPERFRWRNAVGALTRAAGRMRGKDRMRIEEPVREAVLDVPSFDLKREVVLDARRHGVDFDRGEVLPERTVGDLRRYAFLTGTDLSVVQRYVRLAPGDFFAPVDTAAVILVGRAYADAHRKKAHQIWLSVPDPDSPEEPKLHHRILLDRANREARVAERWNAFAKAVMESQL